MEYKSNSKPELPIFIGKFGRKLAELSKKPLPPKLVGVVLFVAGGFVFLSGIIAFPFFSYPWRIDQSSVVEAGKISVTRNNLIIANGNPISWTTIVKRSDITETANLLKLPKEADNIKITPISAKEAEEAMQLEPKEQLSLKQRQEIANANTHNSLLARLSGPLFTNLNKTFKNLLREINKAINPNFVAIQKYTIVNLLKTANSKDEFIKVDFQTPSPVTREFKINKKNSSGKLISVFEPDQTSDTLQAPPITNVLAFTKIPEIYKIDEQSKIQIRWKNNGNQIMDFVAYDTNNNGKLDYVEWTVPHLSNQIFEIIFISKAFELNQNQQIVSDVYSKVQNPDFDYATIPLGNYIRATFFQRLDKTKDITVYARPNPLASSAKIKVYPVYENADGTWQEGPELLTAYDNQNPVFDLIDHQGKYRVLLTNLKFPTDTFDLKVVDSDIDFDYIVDPDPTCTGSGDIRCVGWTNSTDCNNASGGGVCAWNGFSQCINQSICTGETCSYDYVCGGDSQGKPLECQQCSQSGGGGTCMGDPGCEAYVDQPTCDAQAPGCMWFADPPTCSAGVYCNPELPNGYPCDYDYQCSSGSCISNVCTGGIIAITDVTSSSTNGSYGPNQTISIQIVWPVVVDVTGTPQLTISTGSPSTTAINYTSGTGTDTLTFNYTVASGNYSADLEYPTTDSLALNGGTIKSSGTDVVLTLPTIGGGHSLGSNKDLVIDTTQPEITGITSVAGDSSAPYYDTTDDSSTAVVYTASDDATGCKWDTSDGLYSSMANTCASTSSCILNLSGDGAKTIYMRCIDATGNQTGSGYELDYIIDTTAPDITSITSVAGDSSAPYYDTTDDSSTAVVYTADGDAATCKWDASDTTYDLMSYTCASTSSCAFNLSGQGAKTVYMRCQDTAGNKSTSSYTLNYTIDSTPPTQSNWNPANSSTIATATPTITLTLNETGDCKSSTTDQAYSAMTTDCTGDGTTSISCTTGDLGADGAKTVYIACQDSLSNQDTAGTNTALSYTLDTTAPAVTGITSVAGDSSFTYYDTTDDSSTAVIYTTTGDAATCKWDTSDTTYDLMTYTCASTSSCTLNLSGQGAKTVYMRCQDAAGNKSSSSYTLNYIIDSVLPVQSDWSPASSSDITTPTPTTTFTLSENGDCKFSTTDQAYSAMTTDCTGDGTTSISCTTEDLGAVGSKIIYFSCQDTAGNQDTAGTNSSITYALISPPPSGSGSSSSSTDGVTQEVNHNECNNQAQCISIPGAGESQCAGPEDCVQHSVCNQEKQCVFVSGTGDNQCHTNDDCQPATHSECDAQKKCVTIAGVGEDKCYTDTDCKLTVHSECDAQKKCVEIEGEGANKCQTDTDCQPKTHNECNSNQQCVAVAGLGNNQCQSAEDCKLLIALEENQSTTDSNAVINNKTPSGSTESSSGSNGASGGGNNFIENIFNGESFNKIVADPAKAIESITTAVVEKIPEPVKAVAFETKKIVESPQGSVVTKTVSTTGIVVATAATTSSFSFPVFEIFLVPFRLLGLLLTALGIKKRIVPWGVVYDSVTKRPLDPAYVTIKNTRTQKTMTAITDMDGRFGFLVDPGIYQMQAHKTNYDFPSKKLEGRSSDELHNDLYFGENIEVKMQGGVITKNIPLDPVKFDWNEFAKKDKKLMKFYSKWDILLRKVYDFFFVAGFIVAVIAFSFVPHPYNMVIIVLYLSLSIMRIFGLKPKSYGSVIDKTTGSPLSFAIVRIMMPVTNTEIASKPADKYGKYYCLVPPGKYYVKIEKKNNDGSYSLVFTSPTLDTSRKGIIKKVFKV